MRALAGLVAFDLLETRIAQLGYEILFIIDVLVTPMPHECVEDLARTFVRPGAFGKVTRVVAKRDGVVGIVIESDYLLEIRGRQSNDATWSKDAPQLSKQANSRCLREMFDYMLSKDIREGTARERKTAGEVEVDFRGDEIGVQPTR
jgi:hypothetical protein